MNTSKGNKLQQMITLMALVVGGVSLTSCGGATAPSVNQEVQAPYVPNSATAVGQGPDAQATLRAPMGFGDSDLMNAINEVRVSGTVGGQPIEASCTLKSVAPLRFDGAMHHAAAAHNTYIIQNVSRGHIEAADAKSFWGEQPQDRAARSAGLFGLKTPSVVGEVVGASYRTVRIAMEEFMKSEGHCQTIMNPAVSRFGGQMTGDPTAPMPTSAEMQNMTPEEIGRAFMKISVVTVMFGN